MTSDLHDDPAQLPLGAAEGDPLIPAADDPLTVALADGEESLGRNDLTSAANAFREALAIAPGHVRASLRLAIALDRAGNTEAAMAELDRALAINGENVTLLAGRAGMASSRLRYAQAETDLRRALKVTESNAEVYLQLGILHGRRARWREAVEPLRRAIELDPSLVPAYYHLGEAFNHVDELEAARRAFERAAELDPGNWRALQGLGVVFDRLRQPVEAAAAYRRSREAQRT